MCVMVDWQRLLRETRNADRDLLAEEIEEKRANKAHCVSGD
jgi:hypothetical protein